MTKVQRVARTFFLLATAFSLLPSATNAQVTFRTPINTGTAINNYFDNDKNVFGTKLLYNCTNVAASGFVDNHHGIDFPVPTNTPIYAAAAGRIVSRFSGCKDVGSASDVCGFGFGNHYRIDHAGDAYDGSGLVSIYAHLSSASITIATNTPVACGQQLGLSAQSGQVTGPHLHLELRTDGIDLNTKSDLYAGNCSHPEQYWTVVYNGQPTTQCYAKPLTPSNVWTLNPTLSGITVAFRDNALNETAILVERKIGTSGSYSQLANFGALSSAGDWVFDNTGLASNQTYCYRLRAQNASGYSPYSNEACGTTLNPGTIPAAPSNVAVVSLSSSSLRVSFFDNATTETAILIERKTGTTGTYSQVANLGTLVNTGNWSWDSTGLASNQTYCFRVRAQNNAGYSSYSNEACGTTQGSNPIPLAPSNVSVTVLTSSSMRVYFKDNATNETTILMERKKGSFGTYSQVGNFGVLSGTNNWYWDSTGLASRTLYCYRSRAQNASGYSPYSNEACGTTK